MKRVGGTGLLRWLPDIPLMALAPLFGAAVFGTGMVIATIGSDQRMAAKSDRYRIVDARGEATLLLDAATGRVWTLVGHQGSVRWIAVQVVEHPTP